VDFDDTPEEAAFRAVARAWLEANAIHAIHVQCAAGMLDGGVWTTKFLHSPSLRIAGGSDQIQANVIGERVLGLPAEPRPDKDTPFHDRRQAVR
jgi:alkylation response protein AidB-like acyl-CoA dehydrogenase